MTILTMLAQYVYHGETCTNLLYRLHPPPVIYRKGTRHCNASDLRYTSRQSPRNTIDRTGVSTFARRYSSVERNLTFPGMRRLTPRVPLKKRRRTHGVAFLTHFVLTFVSHREGAKTSTCAKAPTRIRRSHQTALFRTLPSTPGRCVSRMWNAR